MSKPYPEAQHIAVPADKDGERLDKVLPLLSDISRRRCRNLIAQGSVYVEGKRVQVASRPVKKGQRLTWRDLDPPKVPPQEEVESWVVAEGPDWFLVNKPAGIAVVPTRAEALTCLTQLYRFKVPELVHPVHRIDRKASGLVLLATNRQSMARLSQAFSQRRVGKGYAALAQGTLEGVVHIDQDLEEFGGKVRSCQTSLLAQPFAPAGSALLVRLHTGRRHQIRRHLADKAHPLLGDDQYGGAEARDLLHLHSCYLAFENQVHFCRPDWSWPFEINDAAACAEVLENLAWPQESADPENSR